MENKKPNGRSPLPKQKGGSHKNKKKYTRKQGGRNINRNEEK